MNIFKRTSIWTNFELWIFKVAVFAFGIIAGVWFYEFFKDLLVVLMVIALVTVVLSGYWWINKMKAVK